MGISIGRLHTWRNGAPVHLLGMQNCYFLDIGFLDAFFLLAAFFAMMGSFRESLESHHAGLVYKSFL